MSARCVQCVHVQYVCLCMCVVNILNEFSCVVCVCVLCVDDVFCVSRIVNYESGTWLNTVT
jgi:hypothetical protein